MSFCPRKCVKTSIFGYFFAIFAKMGVKIQYIFCKFLHFWQIFAKILLVKNGIFAKIAKIRVIFVTFVPENDKIRVNVTNLSPK